jgi:hypothetical protein
VAISSKLVKVITAYFMELALGLLLGLGTIVLEQRDSKRGFPCAVNRAFGVYADAAALLTFSVRFASAIILIKMDFGISAKDFGGLTVEVTWAAALVTMVSMLLVCSSGADLDRKEVRLSVICISWILFLYTFISRMMSDFGPSQIGISKPGSPPRVLSPVEAANITQLCWTDGSTLSKTETIAFDVFAGRRFAVCINCASGYPDLGAFDTAPTGRGEAIEAFKNLQGERSEQDVCEERTSLIAI